MVEDFVRAHWVALVLGWLLLAVLAYPLQRFAVAVLRAVGGAFDWAAERLGSLSLRVDGGAHRAGELFGAVFDGLADIIERVANWGELLATWGRRGAAGAWGSFAEGDQRPIKHALGVVIIFVAVLAFLWADFSLIANAIQAADPLAAIPQFLTYKTVPLMAASAGSAFVLGFLWFDMQDDDGFVRWPVGAVRWLRVVVMTLFVISVVISFFINGERAAGLSVLPESVRNFLQRAHAISQVAVIVPLLATTACLFPGVRIVELVPAALLLPLGAVGALFSGFLGLVGMVLRKVSRVATVLGSAVVHTLRLAIELVGFVSRGIGRFLNGLTEPLSLLFEVVAFPILPFIFLWRFIFGRPAGAAVTTATHQAPARPAEVVAASAQGTTANPSSPVLAGVEQFEEARPRRRRPPTQGENPAVGGS